MTLFDSVGFALKDYAALRYVLDAAKALDIGHELGLVPQLDDPKDLYALLRQPLASVQKKRA
ncbi:ornithine cyclodeaminase [compost metagenome]